MQGKQRQDEDLVKFGLPGRTTCVPSWRAWAEEMAGPGIRGTFALLGAGLQEARWPRMHAGEVSTDRCAARGPGPCRYSWWQRRIG